MKHRYTKQEMRQSPRELLQLLTQLDVLTLQKIASNELRNKFSWHCNDIDTIYKLIGIESITPPVWSPCWNLKKDVDNELISRGEVAWVKENN